MNSDAVLPTTPAPEAPPKVRICTPDLMLLTMAGVRVTAVYYLSDRCLENKRKIYSYGHTCLSESNCLLQLWYMGRVKSNSFYQLSFVIFDALEYTI